MNSGQKVKHIRSSQWLSFFKSRKHFKKQFQELEGSCNFICDFEYLAIYGYCWCSEVFSGQYYRRSQIINIFFYPGMITNQISKINHLLSKTLQTLKVSKNKSSKKNILKVSPNTQGPHFLDQGDIIKITKEKISDIISTIKCELPTSVVTSEDFAVLAELNSSLRELNEETSFLIKEGILSLFLDISALCQTATKGCLLERPLKQIIKVLSVPLRQYFLFQQYNSIKVIKKQQGSTFDIMRDYDEIEQEANVGRRTKLQEKNMKLLKQLQVNINSQSIHDLIEQFLEKELTSIRMKEETCRICFQKMKLEDIQRHVKLCQKVSNLKQTLNDIIIKQDGMKLKVSQLLLQLKQCEEKNQENESLKRVISTFLKQERMKKGQQQLRIRKRSQSMPEANPIHSVKSKWGLEYQEHKQNNGQIQLMSQLLDLQNQQRQTRKSLDLMESLLDNLSFKQERNRSCSRLSQFDTLKPLKQNNFMRKREISISKDIYNTKCHLQFKDDIIVSQNDDLSLVSDSSHSHQTLTSKGDSAKMIKLLCTRTKKTLQSTQFSREGIFESQNFASLKEISTDYDRLGTVSINSFQILKVLGKGAFGKVYMVRRKATQDIYALKIIKLPQNCSDNELKNIQNQHEIFKKIAGDHLVKAPFSFSEKDCHIFILDYMAGGDLRKVLTDQVYFEEEVAKFYLAEIVLAIEHLHKFDIIHRDLKPQNLVLDKEGHLKLTDFGLSEIRIQQLEKQKQIFDLKPEVIERKKGRRTGMTFKNLDKINLIGTPDYIAPEIINQVSVTNKTIDWWSLGIMAYQLIIGTRPFSGNSVEEIIQNIQAFNIQWPEVGAEDGISAKAKSLIEQLLNKNFASRLGAQGADQIKNHPFFQGVNWANLKQEVPPLMIDMTQVKDETSCQEDQKLRLQVFQRIGSSGKTKNRLKLDKLVRFDLLGSETIETVEKIFTQKAQKLKKLKSCRNFNFDLSDCDTSLSLNLSIEI